MLQINTYEPAVRSTVSVGVSPNGMSSTSSPTLHPLARLGDSPVLPRRERRRVEVCADHDELVGVVRTLVLDVEGHGPGRDAAGFRSDRELLKCDIDILAAAATPGGYEAEPHDRCLKQPLCLRALPTSNGQVRSLPAPGTGFHLVRSGSWRPAE